MINPFGFITGMFVGTFKDIFGELALQNLQKYAGDALKRKFSVPDREDLMRTLLDINQMGNEVDQIIEIIFEAGRNGFVEVNGRRYLENDIVDLLMLIDERYREVKLRQLNLIARQSREEFFSYLEISRDDGLMQHARDLDRRFPELLARLQAYNNRPRWTDPPDPDATGFQWFWQRARRWIAI